MWNDFLGPTSLQLTPTETQRTFNVELQTNTLSFVPTHVQARFYFKPNLSSTSTSVPDRTTTKKISFANANNTQRAAPSEVGETTTDRVVKDLLEEQDEANNSTATSKIRYEEGDVTGESDFSASRFKANNNPFWSLVELPLARDQENAFQFNGILNMPLHCIPQFSAVLRIF